MPFLRRLSMWKFQILCWGGIVIVCCCNRGVLSRNISNLEEMTRPGATAILPLPSFHFPSPFNNEFKIPPTTLKMHIVTLFYIFTFPGQKKNTKSKHEQKEFRTRRERLSNFRNHLAQNNIEIALETNGISFPLWLRMSAEEKKTLSMGIKSEGQKGPFP